MSDYETDLLQKLYAVAEAKIKNREPISTAGQIALLSVKHAHQKTEKCVAFYLDTQNRIIKSKSFPGTVDQAAVYPREIARTALLCHANAVILCHNHPAGSMVFSGCDRKITETVSRGLDFLGIKLRDHVLISPYGFKSYKEEYGL